MARSQEYDCDEIVSHGKIPFGSSGDSRYGLIKGSITIALERRTPSGCLAGCIATLPLGGGFMA
jgi:hypothetical protein